MEVLLYVDCHVHNGDLQRILGIVGLLVGLFSLSLAGAFDVVVLSDANHMFGMAALRQLSACQLRITLTMFWDQSVIPDMHVRHMCRILPRELDKQRGIRIYRNIIIFLFFDGDACVKQESSR